VCVFQKVCECFRHRLFPFLKNSPYFLTNVFYQVSIKLYGCAVFIHLKIELDREIGGIFGNESIKCQAKKCRLAGLPGSEKDDVFSRLMRVMKSATCAVRGTI